MTSLSRPCPRFEVSREREQIMGDIGPNKRGIEFEPLPQETQPEPIPAAEPVPEREPEKVPA